MRSAGASRPIEQTGRSANTAMVTVADVMTLRPVTVDADAKVTDALDLMRARGISSVLARRSTTAREYGIVTIRDVVGKVVKYGIEPETLCVGDIATWRLVTATRTWTLPAAAAIMAKAGVRRLPVALRNEIIGIVSDTDLFTALVPSQNWEHARAVRKERAFRRAERPATVKLVADLMSTPVLTADPDNTVQRAVEKMVASGVSSLLVTTSEAQPVGMVTKRDVVTKVIALGRIAATVRVAEIMSSDLHTIAAGVTLETCSARMTDERVRRFPVILGDQIVGIISDKDILAAVATRWWRGHRRLRVPTSAIVADVMRLVGGPLIPAGLPTLSPALSIWEAADRLVKTGARQLPVTQGGQVIGLVDETDLLQALEERGAGD